MATAVQNASAIIDAIADWKLRAEPLTAQQKLNIVKEYTGRIGDEETPPNELADLFLGLLFDHIRQRGTHYVGRKKAEEFRDQINAAKAAADSNI